MAVAEGDAGAAEEPLVDGEAVAGRAVGVVVDGAAAAVGAAEAACESYTLRSVI